MAYLKGSNRGLRFRKAVTIRVAFQHLDGQMVDGSYARINSAQFFWRDDIRRLCIRCAW
jgi:hypothetical protein